MNADWKRRRTVLCACGCGRRGPHGGHGYIKACYARWVLWGRPAEGPPLPGTAPRRVTPRPVPEYCSRGHRLDETTLVIAPYGRRCRACRREDTYPDLRKAMTVRADQYPSPGCTTHGPLLIDPDN